MLELQLLGRVVLRDAGTALPLAIKKTQALLLLLALQGAGSPLPRSRAVALLWPQLDEPSGRRNLRRELARLREAGAGAGLRADGDGLALDAAVDCDLHRFERALAGQRPDEALQIWRGPPADGLSLPDAEAFDDWWAPQRARLLELRRRALEASAATLEARGEIDAALQRIETLLAEDPLQESHHRGAMRLLATAGRREAALARYETCRRLLRDELGLAPMAETERLATELRQVDTPADEAAASAAGSHSQPPAAAPPPPQSLLPRQLPFVGREAEVAALEMAWRAGRCILIEAEGGIGKTRLAVDFAAAHGPFAYVRARPSDAAVPYAAFTRALRALAGPTPDLQALPPWAQAELARLLPQLGKAPAPIGSAAERNRFIEACTLGWLELAADNFDAVVLDDWHHADADSAELLAFIAQRRREDGGHGARELVLCRPEASPAVHDSLQRLRDSSDALHLRLPALDADAVLDLVRQLSGAADPARFSLRLGRATRGNPFYLAETLRHLAEQQLLQVGADGIWHTPFDDATMDYRELPVPASVHAAVLGRVQRLPAAGQRVLEAAALAAEPFVPALLAPACALSELDTVLAIEQAVQAQLLREHDDGGYAFVHDLVQQALEAALTPERRRLVHRRLALGAEAAGAAAALIAVHHEASGDKARALPFRILAGDEAERLHALPQAIVHWTQALADGPGPSQAFTLHRSLMRAAYLGDRQALCVEQARCLQALVADARIGAAERHHALIDVARYFCYCELQPEALRLLDSLSAPADELQRARLLAVRAEVRKELGQVDEAVVEARSALALPALQGRERAGLLAALGIILHTAGRLHEALQVQVQSAALAGELGDEFGVARSIYLRGVLLSALGDASAEAELLRAELECQRVGALALRRAALYGLCAIYSDQTRPAMVLQAATRGWQLQPPMPPGGLRLMYRLAFVDAHHALGELGAAWEHATAALQEAQAVNEVYAQLSAVVTSLELLALLGGQERAAPLLSRLTAEVLHQMAQQSNDMWLARAKVALLERDLSAAAHALQQVTTDIVIGRVAAFKSLTSAELALLQGDPAGAVTLLPAPGAEGMSDEFRLRRLAIDIGAQAHSGALSADSVAEAQAALGATTVHASAALYVHAALAAALRAGVRGAPPTAASEAAAHLARLCESLQAHPAQQAALQRAFAALTSPAEPRGSPAAAARG